jgi:hypothetical protein
MLVSVDQRLLAAIAERRLIRFVYDGRDRIAEPHDYGVRNGAAQLLVYQIGGESRSGGLPEWRCMKLAGMSRLQVLDVQFDGPRDGQHHQDWEQLFASVRSRWEASKT